jgi:hypothetical protein
LLGRVVVPRPRGGGTTLTGSILKSAIRLHVVLIAEVKRFDQAFAWVYARRSPD